jgi:hypothetical protein
VEVPLGLPPFFWPFLIFSPLFYLINPDQGYKKKVLCALPFCLLFEPVGNSDRLNFQNLLPRGYGMVELEEEETEVIENPYDMDYHAGHSTDAAYDLGVLNTSIPAEEIVEMVQNAIAYVVFKGDTERDAIVQFLKLSEGTQSYLHLKHRRKASVPTFIPQNHRKPAVPWSSRNS